MTMSVNTRFWQITILLSLSVIGSVYAQFADQDSRILINDIYAESSPSSESSPMPPKPRYFKDLNRMEMLESRAQVANDPSCHWLNRRMNELETKLQGDMDGMEMRFGYHKKELDFRKKEWICLKCGVEGPSIHDYAICHFRR